MWIVNIDSRVGSWQENGLICCGRISWLLPNNHLSELMDHRWWGDGSWLRAQWEIWDNDKRITSMYSLQCQAQVNEVLCVLSTNNMCSWFNYKEASQIPPRNSPLVAPIILSHLTTDKYLSLARMSQHWYERLPEKSDKTDIFQ